jgi:hypothetical protein
MVVGCRVDKTLEVSQAGQHEEELQPFKGWVQLPTYYVVVVTSSYK